MASVGNGTAGKTLIGTGVTSSPTFASIGTSSGLTNHGVLISQGASAFVSTAVGTTGQVLTGVTGADPVWQTPAGPNSTIQLSDDFIGMAPFASLTSLVSSLSWYNAGINWLGTSALGDSGHNGVISNIALTSTDYQTLFLNNLSGALGPQMILGGGAITLNWVIKVATLSTGASRYVIRLGFGSTENGDQANGVYFEYSDNVNSGQWQYKTANASTRTTSNSTILANTSYHNFQITINAAGTSCAFSIDGVSLGTAITTNIPTLAITPFIEMKASVGTIAASSLLVDLMYFTQNLTSAR